MRDFQENEMTSKNEKKKFRKSTFCGLKVLYPQSKLFIQKYNLQSCGIPFACFFVHGKVPLIISLTTKKEILFFKFILVSVSLSFTEDLQVVLSTFCSRQAISAVRQLEEMQSCHADQQKSSHAQKGLQKTADEHKMFQWKINYFTELYQWELTSNESDLLFSPLS